MLSPAIIGERHYKVARQVQQTLQRYKDLQDIIAILGMDELSEDDKPHGRPRPQDPALPQRSRSSSASRSRASRGSS
jgi:hypothetical protein